MRVTFCAYDRPGYVGGPNAWLRRLLPPLAERGIDPEVLILFNGQPEECPLLEWLKAGQYRHRAARQHPYTEDRALWILQQAAADPPDVFVANLVVPAYYAACWIREAGIPTVAVIHSDDDFHRDLMEEFVFTSGPFQTSGVVCVSRFLEDYVRARGTDSSIHRAPHEIGRAHV